MEHKKYTIPEDTTDLRNIVHGIDWALETRECIFFVPHVSAQLDADLNQLLGQLHQWLNEAKVENDEKESED